MKESQKNKFKQPKPKKKKRKKNLYAESFKHAKDYFNYQKRKNWTC